MRFFTKIPIDKVQIEQAIAQLEKQTSAELRVYVERKMPKQAQSLEVVARATQVFEELNMQHTRARNGVLIYLSFKEQRCAIIGDLGIHQYVGVDFWQQQYQLLRSYFSQREYTKGIVAIIQQIAKELARYFPLQADDQNELPNEVIINE